MTESDREQWLRTRSLYKEVLGLGTASPHRAEALFHLGWAEYRLGNRREAYHHFQALIQGYPGEARQEEARAIATVCQVEEELQQALRFAAHIDFYVRQSAISKLRNAVHIVQQQIPSISNFGYRTRLQEMAIVAGLEALTVLEDESEFILSDSIYQMLYKIVGPNHSDTRLADGLLRLALQHLQTVTHHSSERAILLLRRIVEEFSASPAAKEAHQYIQRLSEPREPEPRSKLRQCV